MIRVVLPPHLRTLAHVAGEVKLEVHGPATLRAVLDALEAEYPMLRGTIRDHLTHQRRAFLRVFACEQDLSHDSPDAPLPEAVAAGTEPLLIVGAMAGGSHERKDEPMTTHRVVSREEWMRERTELLGREKELTRLRDELSRERRALPWVKVDKPYVFDGSKGPQALADLFQGRSQLIVYHFMFDPAWEEGCKSCSFWMDNFDGIDVHLNHRDVSLAVVSRAPIATLQAYRARMGWRLTWVSSAHTDFNQDYHVSFTREQAERGEVVYNYRAGGFGAGEAPGLSVFSKDADGAIYHTYSCYARGLDSLNGAYQLLDLVPKGRDEETLAYTMAWLRHHDRYEEPTLIPFGAARA